MEHFNIAIDGPAGAGKSTIAKLAAKRLGFVYVDTGAMYRTIALHILREGIDPQDEAAVSAACRNVNVTIAYKDGVQQVLLNGENVSGLIRAEEVGKTASATSGYLPVREKLVELQKELAKRENVVMDGRDIGTCVLPDAPAKIYLTASVKVRAERRYKELTEKGIDADLREIERDIESRDYQDMHREHSPLMQAEDAVLLDSSDMTLDEVVRAIFVIAAEKGCSAAVSALGNKGGGQMNAQVKGAASFEIPEGRTVTVAKTAGFCFGVERAVNQVYEQIKAVKEGKAEGPIYTYGPIIHNEEVVRDLEEKGVTVLDTEEDLKALPEGKGTVIIRSHGVSRHIYDILKERGIRIADATCPFVKKIHRIVDEHAAAGDAVVIIGSPFHPEVEGIRGWGTLFLQFFKLLYLLFLPFDITFILNVNIHLLCNVVFKLWTHFIH